MKKFLAAPESEGELIVPLFTASGCCLLGLKSKKNYTEALVVFTGKELTKEDVFAKIIDAGFEIPSVEKQIQLLERALGALAEIKIGTQVRLEGEALVER